MPYSFSGSRISIHALREEGDRCEAEGIKYQWDFYPRPPRGGRPSRTGNSGGSSQNFYPRPPRGGRRSRRNVRCAFRGISIHALREEGDQPTATMSRMTLHFYPRPPRGGRPSVKSWASRSGSFLSTPSARRATCNISGECLCSVFLSTPSARRATFHHFRYFFFKIISIHALREEGDRPGSCLRCPGSYFYPRPPRGGRRVASWMPVSILLFLSTPSARRATCRPGPCS